MTDLTDGRLADNLVLLAVRCDLDGDELGCAAALRQASKRIRELARSPGGASDELENTKRLFSAECNDADRLLSRLLGCKPEDFPAEYRSEGGFLRTGKIENAIRERIAPEPSESRTTSLLLSQAARLLREYADDAHAEDVPDVLRWLAVYEGRAPEPDEKARLMEYAVAAGDCIVAGVPQWRDGWAIISRIQTDPPNERWMLHDADEREKESRAEAVQLALVNTGMDFAVVPIKWRTPTKVDKP